MQSTTIIAFDQHASTTMAAVLLPAHRTPISGGLGEALDLRIR